MLLYHHHIAPRVASQRVQSLIIGAMLGVGASLLMLQPIALGDDINFGNRPMFVAFAGLLGGWIGAATALVFTLATLTALAGPGLKTGVIVLWLAAGFGVLGHFALSKKWLRPALLWAVCGGLVGLLVSLLWIVILPDHVFTKLPYIVISLSVIGVIGCALAAAYIHHGVFNIVNQRQRLMADSLRDDLTKVLNRRGLKMEYQTNVLRGQNFGIALATLDLDRFKQVNDSFGHTIGDRLLKLVADRVSTFVRKSDIVARTGGDEFVIVFTNMTIEEAVETTERLSRAIQEMVVPEIDSPLCAAHKMIAASIGVVFVEAPPGSLDTLLEESDKLLYIAKNRGGACVVLEEIDL